MANSESSTLFQIYRNQLPTVESIAVFPNITNSSKFNPYLSLLYRDIPLKSYSPNPLNPNYILHKKRTILHYNWLQFQDIRGIFVLLIKLLPILLFILIGGKVVWTVHNIVPHRKRFLQSNRLVRRFFANAVSHICVHSESARELVAKELKVASSKISVIAHPPYEVEKLPQNDAKERLRELLPQWQGKKTLLMYGYIDKYKGIESAIQSLKESSFELIIAGKIKDEAYGKEIQKQAQEEHNIHLMTRFISDEEEQILFSAVDGALFNFTNILTSGSMILAASYAVPIFTTPCDTALPKNSQPHIFNNPEELPAILEETL